MLLIRVLMKMKYIQQTIFLEYINFPEVGEFLCQMESDKIQVEGNLEVLRIYSSVHFPLHENPKDVDDWVSWLLDYLQMTGS